MSIYRVRPGNMGVQASHPHGRPHEDRLRLTRGRKCFRQREEEWAKALRLGGAERPRLGMGRGVSLGQPDPTPVSSWNAEPQWGS